MFRVLSGGYYSIEQTKSRLRIIVLNTNFMRHDIKTSQQQQAAHSAPVRQRSGNDGFAGGGSGGGGGGGGSDPSDYGYHSSYGHHYRQGGERQAGGGGGATIYGRVAGIEHGGGTVSALSGSGGVDHEAQKQWEWLEDVLDKAQRNAETVSAALVLD